MQESVFQARPRRAWVFISPAGATGARAAGHPRDGYSWVTSSSAPAWSSRSGSPAFVLATLLGLEESGNTVANGASSSGDWAAGALHRGQCLWLVGHTVTVEIDAAEWAGDYISGTRDASPYRDGTGAHTGTGSFRGVLERSSALFGSLSAFSGFAGTSR